MQKNREVSVVKLLDRSGSGASFLTGGAFEYDINLLQYYLDTWILGVVSKQLRLLHGRVGDSTTSVNSLSPQMSELVEDAVAS